MQRNLTKKQIIREIEQCFVRGNKLLIFGNGGSAAEASHFAAEFIGIGFPAIALTDPAIITSLANDNTYNGVFSMQITALGKNGDVAIGISSSGDSFNVNWGLNIARINELIAIDFPRRGSTTSEVQENQLRLIHQIYDHFKPDAN